MEQNVTFTEKFAILFTAEVPQSFFNRMTAEVLKSDQVLSNCGSVHVNQSRIEELALIGCSLPALSFLLKKRKICIFSNSRKVLICLKVIPHISICYMTFP